MYCEVGRTEAIMEIVILDVYHELDSGYECGEREGYMDRDTVTAAYRDICGERRYGQGENSGDIRRDR